MNPFTVWLSVVVLCCCVTSKHPERTGDLYPFQANSDILKHSVDSFWSVQYM